MNVAFYSLKRAFQSTLRFSRPILASYGLTPARFDLLFALYRTYPEEPFHRTLARSLGVSEATTSRMVTSLEKLGLVARRRCKLWGNNKLVTLTNEGRRRVRLVIEHYMKTGIVSFVMRRAFVAKWWSARACTADAKRLSAFLFRIRTQFGDSGDVDSDWIDHDNPPSRRRRRSYCLLLWPSVRREPPTWPPPVSARERRALDAWRYERA